MTDPAPSADASLVHAGIGREPGEPVVQPPVLASILASVGEPRPGDYGRGGNATWTALEEALGAIEDADAVVFSSGQAASMALMLALADGREAILLPGDGYYNARVLAGRLRPHGAAPVLVDLQDHGAVGAALGTARRGAVLWAETPTNPLLRVADLAALGRARRCRRSTDDRRQHGRDRSAAAPARPRRRGLALLAHEVGVRPLGPDTRRGA